MKFHLSHALFLSLIVSGMMDASVILAASPAAKVVKLFPTITKNKQVVLCQRERSNLQQRKSYLVRAVYEIKKGHLRRLRNLRSLSSIRMRTFKDNCKRGDVASVGSLGDAHPLCSTGDLNLDGTLNQIDLNLLSKQASTPDLDSDGLFGRSDIATIRGCWGRIASIEVATPEPAPTQTLIPTLTPTSIPTLSPTPPITTTPPSTQTPAFGLATRIPVSGVNFPLDDPAAIGGGSGTIALMRAFPALSFNQPIFITHAGDQSNRLFVVEKTGRIRVFANSANPTSSILFLDISTKVNSDGEQGLLGLAFDPNYSQNGFFYVYYSAATGARRSVISRFHVSTNPNVADPNSESIVLQVTQPAAFSNHKGGMITFGPDNMLYIALGDGGSGGDPSNTGQDCSDMLGAILRINPNSGTPYSVPASNPFAGSGTHSCGLQNNAVSRSCGINGLASGQICSEIWSYGLRNPWRFSFDRAGGTAWVADVGQGAWEEVNVVQAGDNLGWRIFEGQHNYNNPNNLPLSNFVGPVQEYPHNASGGFSITGGYVYRGLQIPNLYGKYVYGDYVTGHIWALTYTDNGVSSNVEIASLSNLSSFGEDESGELYAVDLGQGALYRFQPGSGNPGASIPARLSLTGLFLSVPNLQIAAGAVAYDVNAPLWSDGATKQRWLFLPGTQQITFSASDAYNFPIGTALVKHFELQLTPQQSKRLETRIFFRHNQGWTGYTYKWNQAQNDADLLTTAAIESLTVQDPSAPGGSREQDWYYPGRTDCFNCHTAPAGTVLGVRTQQINSNFNYSGTIDNQLRSWNHVGLFSTDIGASSAYDAYPKYGDLTKPIALRARAYLAANCSNCHQPGIPRPGVIDLRYATEQAAMNIFNIAPIYGDLGLSNSARVRTGVKESSVLWERMRRLDENRMPPLASSVVDESGVEMIGEWIDSEN